MFYNSSAGGVGRFILESKTGMLINSLGVNNCQGSSSLFFTKYFCSNNHPSFFQDNTYYILRTEFDKKTIRLFIDNELVGTVESKDPTQYFKTKQLLVGNRNYNGYSFQWNSPISSIKIKDK